MKAKPAHSRKSAGSLPGRSERRSAHKRRRPIPWETALLAAAILAAAGITGFWPARDSADKSSTLTVTNAAFAPAANGAVPPLNPAAMETPMPAPLPAPDEAFDPNDPVQLLNRGKALLEQGRLEDALASYRAALRINPDDEEAHFSLGFVYARARLTNEAIAAYTNALAIFPDYVEAHLNLANLLIGQGRPAEATAHLNTALKIDPKYAAGWNSLGRVLAEQGQSEDAVKPFGEAVRLDPEYLEARFNLGQALTSLRRWPEAEAEFQAALKLNPEFAPARWGLERLQRLRSASPGNP